MRRTQGVLLPPLNVSRPRRGDIYRALHAAILGGVFAPGEQLPSTRESAKDYGVSRGVLEEVFAQLTDEGLLTRAVGRGTFVSSAVSRLVAPKRLRSYRPAVMSRRGLALAQNAACREPAVLRPFNAGIADVSEFPRECWQRLEVRAARELGRQSLNFADPSGLADLRGAIARYLSQFRGIRCTAQQVIVFNSAQQAINLLSILLLNRGDTVWLEDPTYLGARAAFELAGARIIHVPVDEAGIQVDIGIRRATRARMAYVTPSHQYPAGCTLSLERRIALLEWASRNDAWIMEDDYDGEFRYEGQPLASVFSLDSRERVLYIGTFNKTMFVSLRLAYAVVPETLIEPLANIRVQFDGFTPGLRQMAMSLFMDEGYFSTHLRRMRAIYKAKRALLVETLAPLRQIGWTWPSNPAGLHLLLSHESGRAVKAIAADSSLELALLSAYRFAKKSDDGLFLRFGALDMASLRVGASELVEAATRLHRHAKKS